MAAADERSPLLPESKQNKTAASKLWSRIWSTPNRVVFAGFLITLSFSVTQVPYVLLRQRKMKIHQL